MTLTRFWRGDRLFAIEDVKVTLQELGLTRNQSKIYFSLVVNGTSSARQISKCSGAPREKIYDVTKQLQKKGLVFKKLERPIKFDAVPLKECISILIKQKDRELENLRLKSRSLLQKYNQITPCPKKTDSDFVLMPIRDANIRIRREAIEASQENLDILTTWKRFKQILFYNGESFITALKKGVKIRVIVNKLENNKQLYAVHKAVMEDPNFEVKYLLYPPEAALALLDKKEVYFITHPEKNLLDSPMLWSNNSHLAWVIRDYYEIMWVTAMETPILQHRQGGKFE